MNRTNNRNREFHAGRFLQESLRRSGFGIEWIAEKMGYSVETMEKIFAQPDIDAELFVDIGRPLGEAFFGSLDVTIFGRRHIEV